MSTWDPGPDYLDFATWAKLIGFAVLGFGFVFGALPQLLPPAQGIEARSGETPQEARSEGRKPVGEAMRPKPGQEDRQ